MLIIQSPQQAESMALFYDHLNVLISLHVHVCIYRSSTQFRGILLADLGKNGKQLLFSMQMYMYKTNYKLGLICRSSV